MARPRPSLGCGCASAAPAAVAAPPSRGAVLLAIALALAAPVPTPAQGGAPQASPASYGSAAAARDVAELLRARVAAEWGVDASQVMVELDEAPVAPSSAWKDVVLIGTGAGGYWVARSSDGNIPGIRIRAGVWTPVEVAARSLPRGHEVAFADIRREWVVRWGAPVAPQLVQSRIGWRTLRLVGEGEPLDPPAVQPPVAVEPGQVVEVLWKRGGVAVRMEGTAAGRAAVGAEVVVRTGGGRRLRGVAVAPGVVDVTLGRGGS